MPPAILLRESYRDGDKFKRCTLANLSDWPAARIEALRRVLRDEADPVSKLATARGSMTRPRPTRSARCSSLARLTSLDWLLGQQGRIEKALARRHLRNGMLVLYDVTSTYFEGRTCPLAKFGYDEFGVPASYLALAGSV